MPKGDALVKCHPSAGVGVHITATYAGHCHFHNHILHWTSLDAARRRTLVSYWLKIIPQNYFDSALQDEINSEPDQNLTAKHRKRWVTCTKYVVHTP